MDLLVGQLFKKFVSAAKDADENAAPSGSLKINSGYDQTARSAVVKLHEDFDVIVVRNSEKKNTTRAARMGA